MTNLSNTELSSSLLQSHVTSNKVESKTPHITRQSYALGFLFSAAVFFLIAKLTDKNIHFSFETSILLLLHEYATPLLDRLAILASATPVLSILGTLIYLSWKRRWASVTYLLYAVIGAEVIMRAAKDFFQHSRPHLWDVITHQSSFGFPSGHATQSMVLVLSLLFLSTAQTLKLTKVIVCAIFIFIVGFSRLYLGVHFPIDILAGWALAAAWICAFSWLVMKLEFVAGRNL